MARQTTLQLWKNNARDADYGKLLEAVHNKEVFPSDQFPFSRTSARKILVDKGLIQNPQKGSTNNHRLKFDVDQSLTDEKYVNTSVLIASSTKQQLEIFYKEHGQFKRKHTLSQLINDALHLYE